MDPPKKQGKANPYPRSKWLSKLTFSWAIPLLKHGFNRRLEHQDVYQIPPNIETTVLTNRLQKSWDDELCRCKSNGRVSLWRSLFKAFGFEYCLVGIIFFLEDMARFLQPIILIHLIDYFSKESQMSAATAYLLATAIALCSIMQAFLGPHIVFSLIKCGMTWQAGVCGMLYRKLLKLSNSSRNSVTSGHIIDLMSSDSEKIDWLIWFGHSVWQAPLHVLVATVLLYMELGPSIFAALLVICIVLPLQSIIAKVVAHYQQCHLDAMDKRVGIMEEIIGAMRVIKMYCWEKPFGDIIHGIRKKELKYVLKGRIWSSFLSELFTFNERLITAVIVATYILTEGPLVAAKIFPAFALIHIVADSLLDRVSWGIKTWLDVGVSVKRIENFLLLEENKPRDSSLDTNVDTGAVSLTSVCASWSLDSAKMTLNDIYLDCKKGELLMIAGDVGCGKTSILQTILGELPITEGKISCGGSIAYVPQQAWVFSSTLRQNILFGKKFEPERYYQVIKAAVLEKDLSDLPYGDKTLVGEKGVALSGGQKARVNLARALYADADVYLLDDPLSAVDTKVGNQIMSRCIKRMLKNKTVILVTHQLQYLPEASNIIVIKDGSVEKNGTYHNLVNQGYKFVQHQHSEEIPKKILHRTLSSSSQDRSHHLNVGSELSLAHRVRTVSVCSTDIAFKRQMSHKECPQQDEEERERGTVSLSVYKDFFKAGSSWLMLFLFAFLCIATQAAYNLGDWWLAVWCDTAFVKHVPYHVALNNTHEIDNMTQISYSYIDNITTVLPNMTADTQQTDYSNNTMFYGGIFLSLILGMIVLGLVRCWLFFTIMIDTAKDLHNRLYQSVVRAHIRFFDKTPKGRIINRFSGDMEKVDDSAPSMMLECIQHLLIVLGSVIVIMVLNPYVIAIAIPVVICLVCIRIVYLRTQRHICRLFSTAKSPLMGHLSSSIEGASVIRSFQNEEHCITDFEDHYDHYIGLWFTELGGLGWFQLYSLFMTAVFSTSVIYACVYSASYLKPGQAGLIISYLSPLLWKLTHTLWSSSEVELQMVGVERVLEYTKLPSEKELESDDKNKPPDSWPVNGDIMFDQVSFAYANDMPTILHSLNLKIEGGKKIGIVGRTGAGKSSLIQALFRMAEPEGEILVDKHSLNDMGLHDVRGSMSIIPQDPVLFSGSIRSNLDPFKEMDDKNIWEALQQVQLKDTVSQLQGGLDGQVIESGHNFSVGQRQLFCLARAVLRRKKILILDEATANVDKRTDDLIQQTLREEFQECTVLTVAHRLNTVMDSDKIMVLDQGHLVEFDAPYNLLQRKGLLYTMVEQTGKDEQQRLTDIALNTYNQRTTEAV